MSRLSLRAVGIRTFVLLAALCLAACGGGDDDGDGSGGSGKPRLTVNPTSLVVIGDADVSSQPTGTVTVTLHNGSPNGTYIAMRYTTNAILAVDFYGGATQGTVTVTFEDPTGLEIDSYSDTLELVICEDSACEEVQEGSLVTVPVTYNVTAIATVSLTADPEETGPGVPTTLTWTSTNAESCRASGEWSGTLRGAGFRTVTPQTLGEHIYSLTCSNPGAPAEASVTVTALPSETTLTAFPSTVVLGKPVTLRWRGVHAADCVASGDWSGPLATEGFRTLTPTQPGTLDFRVECSNDADTSDAGASVTVLPAPDAAPATAYRMSESHDGVLLTSNGISHPATSAPTWIRDLGAPVSYPLIADGKVFVTTALPDGSYGNLLYALDRETGATIWGPVAIAGVYFGSGLTYHDGRVFVLMHDAVLFAFNASNGAPLWATQLPGYSYHASPNAYGGFVFVSGNGGLSAVDATSGVVLWTTQQGGSSLWSSPAVSSEGIYTQNGYCIASGYEPITGDRLWESESPCDRPWDYAPVIKNGILYGRVGSSLNLFDSVTGNFLLQIGSWRAPAVTETAVLAANADTLSSTRLSDFVQTWTFTTQEEMVSAPVVVNDTVFTASSDGKVYGLNVQTGAEIWTGLSPVPISYDSENGGPMPPSGPAAGEGLLVFPAYHSIVAWRLE